MIIIWLILWLMCTSIGLCDVVVLWQLAKHLNVSSCFFGVRVTTDDSFFVLYGNQSPPMKWKPTQQLEDYVHVHGL